MSPKLNLYIHIPVPIFKARVNMTTITYPLSSLVYDTVTLGAFADIQFDATLLLGTAEGLDDLGRVRVNKPADATNIYIARSGKGYEDGTLVVQNNAYITILDDYRVWAKLPYFDTEAGIDYKDGDVAVGEYTDAEMPPVSNCGPGVAGYIVQGPDTLTVEFPRDGIDVSFPMANGATLVTYDWDVKDGTITVGTSSSTTITATFPPGFRWVALTVTDSNGISHTSRCPVLAIDGGTAPEVTDPTFKAFNVKQNFEKKGSTLEIEIFDELNRDDYPDGSLVMFWVDSAADPGDRDHMRFIGWLDKENHGIRRIRTGLQKSTSLAAVDVCGRLSMLPGFPQALTREVEDPEGEEFQWSYMPDLDMQKALHYLLLWHSTALSVADFTLPSLLTSYTSMRLDSGAASLFDQVDQQAQKVVPDHYLTCNAQGQMNVRRDWRLDDLADRPAVADTVTVMEWNDLTFDYNRHPKYHVLRSGAILASTDWAVVEGEDTLPLAFSIAPSDASAFSQGTTEMTQNEGLALDQEGLNICEGHRYAMVNSRFGNFTWKDPTGEGFYLWEPALMNRIQLNMNALLSTYRGLPFTEAIGMTETMTVEYKRDKKGTSITPTVTWKKEEEGFPALTYDPESGTVEPEPPPYVPDFGLIDTQELMLMICSDRKIYTTSDFLATSPTWSATSALGTSETWWDWVVDPFSPGYIDGAGNINGWLVTASKIYKIEDMFAGSPTLTAKHTFANTMATSSQIGGRRIAASFGRFQSADEDNPWLMVASYYGPDAAIDGLWITYSVDGGETWSTESQINSHQSSVSQNFNMGPSIWLSPRTPGKAYVGGFDAASAASGHGFITTDWGATWGAASGPDLDMGVSMGQNIHVPWPDNEDEALVYFGHVTIAGATRTAYLHREDAGGVDDITPVSGGDNMGLPDITSQPFMDAKFAIRTFDSDRNYVSAVLHSYQNGKRAGWYLSEDGGDTWVEKIAPSVVPDDYPGAAAFSGNDRNVLYLWGKEYFKYTTDFGTTIDDKLGNVAASFDSSSIRIFGIAGGPTS